MTEELQGRLAGKKSIPGGCHSPNPRPAHHCNSCGKDFGGNYCAEPTYIRELLFCISGYMGISECVHLDVQKYGKILRYSPQVFLNEVDRKLGNSKVSLFPVEEKWNDFNGDLLSCYFMDWKRSYFNPDVLDGTQWELTVTFDNGITVVRDGSNDYPPHWKKLIQTFRKYGVPLLRNR